MASGWIIFALLVIGVLFALAAYMIGRKKHTAPDYYTFYIMGMTWFIVGIPLENWGLTVLGLIFMVVALLNKDKWKTNRKEWHRLDHHEKNQLLVVIVGLIVLVVVGVIILFLSRNGLL